MKLGLTQRWNLGHVVDIATEEMMHAARKKPKLKEYNSPPEPSRLDDLDSFLVLGIDIKITPSGEVKVIEINGLNSGTYGFKKAGIREEIFPEDEQTPTDGNGKFSLEHLIMEHFIRNPLEAKLQRHLRSYGYKQLAYISLIVLHEKEFCDRLEGGLELNQKLSRRKLSRRNSLKSWVHQEWDLRYGPIAKTVVNVERVLKDKLETSALFFDGIREFKPQSYKYIPESFELVKAIGEKYIVIKPRWGKRGEGITIIDASSKESNVPNYNSAYICESFIPSKPIYSQKTSKDHDGCMRYIVLVEKDKHGNVKVYHYGGYWRLCKKPITSDLDPDAMLANLCRGAIPERASSEDLSAVREAVNHFVPIFYKNMTDRIEAGHYCRYSNLFAK